MTDPDRPETLPPHSPDDLLAAEFVLGTLDPDVRRAASRRAEVDGAFAALIRDWEARLAPLNAGYAPQDPPEALLPQIEARLFARDGTAQPPARRAGRLRGWLFGGASAALVAALALLAVLVWLPPQPPLPADLRGELRAEADALIFEARWNAGAGVLDVARLSGPDAAEGQDYELWVIDDSGVPRSLGLLREAATRITAPLAEGMTLAISLEPAGGSPDPVPSGPVLAAAPLMPAAATSEG